MKLIDGEAFAERLLSYAITDDQRRQANMIAKVIEEMPESVVRCKDCRLFKTFYLGNNKIGYRCLWTLADDVEPECFCSKGVKI